MPRGARGRRREARRLPARRRPSPAATATVPARRARTGSTANLRTMPTSLWAAAVPSPQMHRPQWSSVVGSSVQRPLRSIRLRQAPLYACASFKNRTASPARPFTGAVGVGLSGGHDEHPGHVVGAVAVLGPGFGEAGVLEGAATVGQPQQMVEVGGRCRGRSYQRPPVGEEPVRQTQIRAGHDRPRHLRRQSTGLGGHGAGEARLRQHLAQGGAPARPDRRGRRRCPLRCRGARRHAEMRWPQRACRSRWRRPEHRR